MLREHFQEVDCASNALCSRKNIDVSSKAEIIIVISFVTVGSCSLMCNTTCYPLLFRKQEHNGKSGLCYLLKRGLSNYYFSLADT